MSRDTPAFPSTYKVTTHTGSSFESYTPGMTLRDWFAGQALAGMMTNPKQVSSAASIAAYAYEVADAMMKARGG